MSNVSVLSHVDWQVFAAAIATFVGTLYLSLKGLQRGRHKVEGGNSSITSIVGASIIENQTIKDHTRALEENTECLQALTRQLERHNDLVVMIGYRNGKE